ncbi:MAG: hypothetical protein QM482_10595 [Sulfurospirillum sp.]
MQTIKVNIQDSFLQDFLTFVDHYKDKIQIKNEVSFKKDEKLVDDPYFYERQKELLEIRKNIKNGKSQLSSFEEFEQKTDIFAKKLASKYAD